MIRLTKMPASRTVLIQTWDETHAACEGKGEQVIHWPTGLRRMPCTCYSVRSEPDLANPEE